MALNPDSPLGKLMATLPQTGQVTWIGVRPARDARMLEVDAVQATAEAAASGLTSALGFVRRSVRLERG